MTRGFKGRWRDVRYTVLNIFVCVVCNKIRSRPSFMGAEAVRPTGSSRVREVENGHMNKPVCLFLQRYEVLAHIPANKNIQIQQCKLEILWQSRTSTDHPSISRSSYLPGETVALTVQETEVAHLTVLDVHPRLTHVGFGSPIAGFACVDD